MKKSIMLSKDIHPYYWDISIGRNVLDQPFPLHCHDFFEIELIVDGEGEQNLNGKRYPLRKGSAYIVRPTDFHSVDVNGSLTLLNIGFDEILLSDSEILNEINIPNDFFAALDEARFRLMIDLINALKTEMDNGASMYSNVIKRNYLELILINIIRLSGNTGSSSMNTELRQILTFINRNFTDAPSLERAAKEIGYNPAYFSSWFHKNTGKRYTEYLNGIRLSEAKRLLLTTSWSVTEIAFASGFQSFSGFLLEFKKKFGLTPSKMRKDLVGKA